MSRVAAPNNPPESLTWADSRLRLGQSNVGFWTLMAAGVLAWGPSWTGDGLGSEWIYWTGCVVGFVLLQLPFDIIGGWSIPNRYGRGRTVFSDWWNDWFRGALVHSSVSVLGGWFVLTCAHLWGEVAGWVSAMCMAVVLVAVQGWAARWIGKASFYTPKESSRDLIKDAGLALAQVDVLDVAETGFAGNWVGLPGRERLIVPKRWITTLSKASLKMALRRRAWALNSGARWQGVVVALAFVALGLGLALWLIPTAGMSSASELMATSAGFTLWSFLGLLTLPSLSRRAVMGIDRMTVSGPHEVDGFEQTIRELDRDQEDESNRPVWVERIFHPVPAPDERVKSLKATAAVPPGWMPYRVTRNMIFTSWAGFSWLSRAVHCNCGRPVLWAIPPGD